MRETNETRVLTADEFKALICGLNADQIERINNMLEDKHEPD